MRGGSLGRVEKLLLRPRICLPFAPPATPLVFVLHRSADFSTPACVMQVPVILGIHARQSRREQLCGQRCGTEAVRRSHARAGLGEPLVGRTVPSLNRLLPVRTWQRCHTAGERVVVEVGAKHSASGEAGAGTVVGHPGMFVVFLV